MEFLTGTASRRHAAAHRKCSARWTAEWPGDRLRHFITFGMRGSGLRAGRVVDHDRRGPPTLGQNEGARLMPANPSRGRTTPQFLRRTYMKIHDVMTPEAQSCSHASRHEQGVAEQRA